jgi:MATE family multidrug resistance protein
LFGTLVSAIAAANILNVGLNQMLINGVSVMGISVPAMGLQGAAWATTISRWFLLGFLLLFSRRQLRWGG